MYHSGALLFIVIIRYLLHLRLHFITDYVRPRILS